MSRKLPRYRPGDKLPARDVNAIVDAIRGAGIAVAAPLEMTDADGVAAIRDGRPSVVFARITGSSGSPPAHTWRGIYDDNGTLTDWPTNVTDNGVDFIYESEGQTIPVGVRVIARRLPGSMKLWTQVDQCP